MEFDFNLNQIFRNHISKLNYTLLPEDFTGVGSQAQHVMSQVAEMVDAMGLVSAKAQGLHHPITSAEKMRNSDHTLYLMIDSSSNRGKGGLLGLLKVGMKNLFLHDAQGKIHEKRNLCVLDFYIHESNQRSGFGKQLFDFMLKDNGIVPCKLAMDKPPQNFLSFLYKHYGLAKIYPQNNNFVIFDGFFNDVSIVPHAYETQIEEEVRTALTSACDRREREHYMPTLHGRHAAYKLPDTMAEIVGSDGSQSPTRDRHVESGDSPKNSPQVNDQSDASQQMPETVEEIDGDISTVGSLSPTRNGEEHEDHESHGRHTAFKLPDTMQQIIGDSSTVRD